MEEKIQSLISTIWETSLNIEDEELIIKKLHKICFKDPLRHDQIIFLCSRLVNSEVNLFKYLEANCGDKDRKSTSFRRKIIEFLKEFLVNFSQYCLEYLDAIKQICSSIYISEQSLVVKEKIVSLIAKIIEHYDVNLVEKIYRPKNYLEFLLDEIKLKRLGGTIKGGIWHIIGILVEKYSMLLNDYKIEIHDVLFFEFKNLISNTKKFEFKAVVGVLKSYLHLLEDPHLTGDQINSLYIYLKTMMKPLEDANSIKINKLALEIISSHGKVFYKQIQKDSINLFDDIFALCNHKNQELKMAANEAIEKISMHISDSLLEDNDLHKDAFKYLILKIKTVLETKSTTILSNTAISLIGIFANAIVRFMGENILQKYLEELIVLFDQDILHALGREAFKAKKLDLNLDNQNDHKEKEDLSKPSKSIKYVLAIQKQYISLLNSYSNIIGNLTYISELVVNHFYKILLVGFSTHQKFYEKYKAKLSDSIASIIVNMFKHQNFFWSFLRKVIKNGFIESIKLTTNMLFKENVETSSTEMSVVFWINLLNRDKIFTEFTLVKVFDQLMMEIAELFSSLNLNYREVSSVSKSENYTSNNNLENNSNSIVPTADVYYEAEDMTDLEICNRVTSFLKEFLKRFNLHKLFAPWVIVLLKKLCFIASNYPRISSAYTALSSILKYCGKINFFANLTEEIKSFISEFESFNKNSIKKLEIFQDDLLLSTIEFLLSLPTQLMRIIYTNDVDSIKYIFTKAFEIGYNDIRYAKLALNALRNWLGEEKENSNNPSNRKVNDTIKDILPVFGDYLVEYEKIKTSIDPTNVELIEKYNKVQNKIFKILGEIGGEAHNIISEESSNTVSKSNKKENILNILNNKTIEYSLPLYNKKYPVYFDHIIIKIADYAQNSFIKEKKYAAAELLHSLILYIIGLETKKSNMDNTNILVFLIDKVLNLACDLEKAISLIYETLLFQIIHWMAKKGSLSENKDIISMLDIIIENTSSRKNLKLRDISAECVSEYIKWFIKQHTDFTIKEKAATIKYIVRRIESNAQHPDSFKRLGAVLCFEKIIPILSLNDSLVDKFIIEICFYCISILKISHNSSELSEIIFSHISTAVNSLLKTFSKKYNILSRPNPKRNFFKDLFEFWSYLSEKHLIVESECRYISQYIWHKLFEMLKSDIGFENPKQYFYLNKCFPKLNLDTEDLNKWSTNSIHVDYHFLNFVTNGKILELNDITIYYQRYSIENNIEDFKKLINLILKSKEDFKFDLHLYRQIFLSFIFIAEIIEAHRHTASKIFQIELSNITNKNSNLIDSVLDTIETIFIDKNFRKLDAKFFILDSYDNLYLKFLRSFEKILSIIMQGAILGNKNYIGQKIENYLTSNVIFFKNLTDRNNYENLVDSSINETSVEFYFNLLNIFSEQNPNSTVFTYDFIGLLKVNFKLLLSVNHPKFQNLVKNYFNFLFTKDFKFITETICENQFNFDYLADFFFNMINKNYMLISKTIEDFIRECCHSEERIFLLFILMERSIWSKSNLVNLISKIFNQSLKNFGEKSIDAVINQIKISNLILYNYLENSTSLINFSKADIENLSVIVDMYLNKPSINIVKEIVNFLGLLVKLATNTLNISNNFEDKTVIEFLKIKMDDVKIYYRNIQSKFFPIKTKYLKQNTKEFNDFQLIYNSFLNTFKTVKSFEFLELLFPIIREEKTQYSIRVKNVIKEYINEILNSNLTKNTNNFFCVVNEIQKVIDIFLNKEIDRNLKDNIRFTIMRILGFKLLNKCDIEILKEIFIRNYKIFEEIIKQNIMSLSISNETKFLIILEKTIVFKFLEICFKRFPVEMLKNEIHKKLFGENAQGNELTKILILELHNSKRVRIPDWEVIAKSIKLEEVEEEYTNKVENKFYCGAYNSLAALIKATQIKEEVFVKFLFQTFRDKNEKLWDLLISDKFSYTFAVETNFISKEINKNKAEEKTNSQNARPKKLLIDEIITDSFFHDAYGKTLKETLVLEQKTLNLEKPKELSKMLIENLEGFTKKYKGENSQINTKTLIEEDIVNRHPIMENLLLILDFLYKNFTVQNPSSNVIPPYIQHILAELNRSDCHINSKIFFIKVIINKPEIFHNYLSHFLPVLIKFSSDKNNGGKGFHYFLRDIATLICSAKSAVLEFSQENVDLVSNYINYLIKVSGDTKNIIFKTNLRIISDLMEKFQNLIYLNKKTIIDMLKIDDSKPASHIWKISAVQILASALDFKIPITDEEIYNKSNINNSQNKFITSLGKSEEILTICRKLIESHRTPVQSATIEFLAKILYHFSNSLDTSNKDFILIYDCFETNCLTKLEKVSINIIFRTSLHFKTFLLKKKIFSLSLTLFKKANQNNRNLLLNTFNNLLEFLIERMKNGLYQEDSSNSQISDKNFIDDIYWTIYELREIIFVDPNDELLTNFTIYIVNLLKTKDEKYKEGVKILIEKIQKDVLRKEEYTRLTYYQFLINLYENYVGGDVHFRRMIINLIVMNLDREPEHEIKKNIIEFLNKTQTMPVDPVDRLLFLLENLNDEIIEEKLIQTLTKLLLILTANSADYNLKIYEKSLSECEYRDLNVNTVGYYLNRSQPVAPSMTIRSSMDEAYQTIVNISQKDVSTQVGYLRSTLDLFGTVSNTQHDKNSNNSNKMIIETTEVNVTTNTTTNNINRINTGASLLSSTPQEMFLSQHTSLIASNQNYINMNKKPINTGLKLSGSPLDFKEPLPLKKKTKGKGFGKFLADNDMFYTPIEQSQADDHKIRFVPDGSQKDHRKQKEEMKDVLIKKWLIRQSDVNRKQVKLMRQYRVGDLPDILICNREIIDPLILLCDFNLEISSELFLEVMNSVYIESISAGKHNSLHQLLENLLKNAKISNFLIISCLHRFMYNMMTVSDEYIPDLYIIKKTGLFTKNYHSSILILEEFILNNTSKVVSIEEKISGNNQGNKSKKMIKEVIDLTGEEMKNLDIVINSNNKNAWTNLLKFYSRIKLSDYEVGLIQNFADYRDLFIKNKSDFLPVLSELLTKSKNYINRNIDTSNLLKAIFNIKDVQNDTGKKGNVNSGNKFYDIYDENLFVDEDLKETIEEYSIKYCSDLGEWDNIANYLMKNNHYLADEDIYKENPDKIEGMLKSWVYTEEAHPYMNNFLELNKSISSNLSTLNKNFIEDTFTHYMSLFSIIQKDFDRALLYHQKAKQNFFKMWLNLGVNSGGLRHELINKIQKIHEVSEFLEFIRGNSSTNANISMSSNLNLNLTPEGSKNIISLFENWISRWPNYIFDDAGTFEEVYSERKIFYESFKSKFYNFEHIIDDSPVLRTYFPRSHTEISTTMFKKDFLDLAEIHTRKALQMRKDDSISNAFIILPVLRNKYKILEIESTNKTNIVQFNLCAEKYEKSIKVLNDQIKNVKLDSDNKEQLNILRVKMYLNVAFNYLEEEISQFTNNSIIKIELDEHKSAYSGWFKKAMNYFNEEVESHQKKMKDENEDPCANYIKLLRPVIKFSDKIIRKITSTGMYVELNEQMSQIYMENSLKGLIMGDKKVINTIPKILDILSKNPIKLGHIFNSLSSKVNSQFYLKWKNQLIAYINSPISKAITPIIQNILNSDPQSLYFPFSVIEKYSDILIDYKQKSELFVEMKNFYTEFYALNSFLEALDGLTNPEHRLKYWLENLKEVVNGYISSIDISGDIAKVSLNKISNIIDIINYDILEVNKTYVGRRLGSYNIKFSKDFHNIIKTNLSMDNFKNLLKKRSSEIIKEFTVVIDPIYKNLQTTLNSFLVEGIERLSTFSEWLAQYECSEFTNSRNYIELPFEESEIKQGKLKKVMISSFDQHVLILSSIRRPKRLTIYGNDEKSYMFLVKGGEDIRLDQRIMEVFKAYNEILAKDSNCTKKNLKLNSFAVFPMTLKLGMIEWINNTTPLKNVIKYSMNKLFNSPDWDLKHCPNQIARFKWLNSVFPEKPIAEQHYILLHMSNSKEVVNAFTQHENLMPKTVLKKGLEHYLLTPEEILTTRVNFIRNYSALCIAGYILGIGDRHLENFLINTNNSEILAIDFGVAFGQGVMQIIPELVPFRFTNQIRNVVYPFGKKGAVRQTMIDTLSAFKNNKEYILDYCEVFVKEPLLDWIKLSKSKLSSQSSVSSDRMEKPTGSIDMNISWLPMKKLSIIENKLSGVHPVHVIMDELSDGKHHDKTMVVLKNILYGDSSLGVSLRSKLKEEKYLEIEDQVDILIEQASDKNLLARMWSGWSPYI